MIRNKRCIPKEVMPHAHKKCQKKEKKKREKDSPYPKIKKKEQERDDSYNGVHTPSTKNIFPHTCTSWSRFMTCFSFRSGFWLSKIWEASLPLYPPYLQLHQKEALGVGWKRKAHKKALGTKHFWAIWEIIRGTYKFLFKNFIKTQQIDSWAKE